MKKLIFLTILCFGATLFLSQPAQAQTNNSGVTQEQAGNSRVVEATSRIVAKFEQRFRMYQEFLNKAAAKRNILAGQSLDVSELDRLIRVSETSLNSTQNKVLAFKNTVSNLPSDNSNLENVRIVLTGVKDVRLSFSELQNSVRDIVKEIANLSN